MNRTVESPEEAGRDMKRLDHSARIQVNRGIRKAARSPVSICQGGGRKLPGNHHGST